MTTTRFRRLRAAAFLGATVAAAGCSPEGYHSVAVPPGAEEFETAIPPEVAARPNRKQGRSRNQAHARPRRTNRGPG